MVSNGRSGLWKHLVLGVVAFICFKLYTSGVFWSDLRHLTEFDKCPACFGTSLCPAITGGHITHDGFRSLLGFISLLGSKNVLFASMNDKKIVLKKLGHNWELEQLDKILCGDSAPSCDGAALMLNIDDIRSAIATQLTHPVTSDHSHGLRLCPSVTNMDHFLSDILLKNSGVQPDILYMNIWTLVVLNGEPLILQVLDAEQGWPVPKYYGACGRVVAEEYVGDMLSSFLNAPWLMRVRLAHQLLVAARDFTNKHPRFRFYLTDISMDNIAVDAAGNVKFIDIEDVIIVDKQVPKEERPVSWNSPHVSEKFECDDCFAFSPDDICNHHVSDHNYFAVCQQLLASDNGLLSEIPSEVLKVHPQLPVIVEECAFPSSVGGRFKVAQQLTTLLANIANL